MSLTANTVIDSLPYIDHEPTPNERAAAQSLIDIEQNKRVKQDSQSIEEEKEVEREEVESDQHPSMHKLPCINFSPRIQFELERIQNKQPLNAIDLSRYEVIDLSTLNQYFDITSSSYDPESLHNTLRSIYVSQVYLNNRRKNLELLDKFGKNSWLLGNAQLESILRDLERDLAQRKTEIDICALERKSAQDAVAGEIKSLEASWKRAMGRALETEIAVEDLKNRISLDKI